MAGRNAWKSTGSVVAVSVKSRAVATLEEHGRLFAALDLDDVVGGGI